MCCVVPLSGGLPRESVSQLGGQGGRIVGQCPVHIGSELLSRWVRVCVCVCVRERERVVCVREGMGERKVDNVFNLNWLVASLVINQTIHVRSYDIRLAFSVRSLRK